jgi:hypothetical protein
MVVTRRRFLTRAAAAGGASLVYEAMTGLGLLASPAQARFELSGQVSNVRGSSSAPGWPGSPSLTSSAKSATTAASSRLVRDRGVVYSRCVAAR